MPKVKSEKKHRIHNEVQKQGKQALNKFARKNLSDIPIFDYFFRNRFQQGLRSAYS